jgi:hypothetical protein
MKIHPVGATLFHVDGQTGMTKPTVTFHNFADMPKNATAAPDGYTLDAKLLARSQYSEGPATGPLDTSFAWFPRVCKQTLRWLLCFQDATTCFSCSPPNLKLNVSVTSFIFLLHVK